MKRVLGLLGALALGACPALAQDAVTAQVNTGDTAWVLTSAALVLFMTPGLALFYAGMVRRKNVLGTLLHSYLAMGVVSVLWVLVGFSIAFAPGNALAGGFAHLGLGGLTETVWPSTGIPPLVFVIYQAMFAIITPALISGAVAERMRVGAYLVFIALWSLLVYAPLAHWVWSGDGFLYKLGALDFAGGNVVHVSSGVSALVACLVLGGRRRDPIDIPAPHNLTMTVLGAGILWFGWFGFNAGSALGANNLAATAFVNTNTAAAAAMLGWCLIEQLRHGRMTALGAVSGAVAGLVVITPAAGFVTPVTAIVMGLVVAAACYFAIELKSRLGYDDTLDAFGVHGIGGATGAILLGLFATKAVNSAGQDGLFFGNPGLLWTQLLSVVVTVVYAAVMTFVILKVVGAITPLVLSDEEQNDGMDLVLHEEVGYRL